MYVYMFEYMYVCMYVYMYSDTRSTWDYGVATISRLLKIIGLFCKRALWKRLYSAKETYHFEQWKACAMKVMCTHIYILPYILICMYVFMYVCMYTCMYIMIHVTSKTQTDYDRRVHIYIHIHTYIWIYVCQHRCMYVSIHVHV